MEPASRPSIARSAFTSEKMTAGECLAGVYRPASVARRRRSKLRQRRRAAGTLVLYRRRPSGVHGQQILAVTRDHLGIAVAAGDFVFAHPIPIAGRISAPDAQTGIRKTWIRFLQQVLADNPAIEVASDVPPFKFTQWDGKLLREIPRLRVKPGARLDPATVKTGYADMAIES